MQGYNLFVKFYSPIIYYTPPILDGIIAYCIAREENKNIGFPQLPCRVVNTVILQKLLLIFHHVDTCPISSYFQPLPDTVEYLDSWKKRFHSKHSFLIDSGKSKKRIHTGSGQYRSYNMPLPGKVVNMGYFAFIGDGQKIVSLFDKYIVGIGKKSGEGFGWVDKIELIECDYNFLDVMEMRPIPLFLSDRYYLSGQQKICGWKPPYWFKKNISHCIVPE